MSALQLLETVKNDNNVIVAKLWLDPKSKTKLIWLSNVRASFPFVGTAGEDEDENGNKKKSWRCMGMLPKATHGKAKELIERIFRELLTQNDAKVPRTEWALQDGDGEKYEDDKYKAMHGHWLINAKDAKIHPRVYRANSQPMDLTDEGLSKIDDMFYGGCWVNMMIRPWFFNGKTKNSPKTFPKRLLAGLQSVQFHHDDDAFGNGRIDDSGIVEAVEGYEEGGSGMDGDDEL